MTAPHPKADRGARIEYIAGELLPRVALLTRVLARQVRGELTRTEAGVLNTLAYGPRRITELAELEGVAQPTMTQLVKGLERRALVSRDRHGGDGRVVVVSATAAGSAALEEFRDRAAAVLETYLADLSDDQIGELAGATETLSALAAVLQGGERQ